MADFQTGKEQSLEVTGLLSLDKLVREVCDHYLETEGKELNDACLILHGDYSFNAAFGFKYGQKIEKDGKSTKYDRCPFKRELTYGTLQVFKKGSNEIMEDVYFIKNKDALGVYTTFVHSVPYGDKWELSGLRPVEDCLKLETFLMKYVHEEEPAATFQQLKWTVRDDLVSKELKQKEKEAENMKTKAESNLKKHPQDNAFNNYVQQKFDQIKLLGRSINFKSKSTWKKIGVGLVIIGALSLLDPCNCREEQTGSADEMEQKGGYRTYPYRNLGITIQNR